MASAFTRHASISLKRVRDIVVSLQQKIFNM